jgi:uncharacterized membrane protein YfcA
LSPGEAVVIAAVGLAAGAINTVIGSGSLITFPALVALGYAPTVANVTNNIGLIFGSATGTFGYRAELAGQGGRAVRLLPAAAAGGLLGAGLLLVMPGTFERVVPFLLLLAVALVAIQPWVADRIELLKESGRLRSTELIGPAWAFVFLTGIYGGYFGAAQGVLLVAGLGLFLPDHLQRLNGLKNLLATAITAVAGILFAFLAPVAWDAALLMAVGAIAGGVLGASLGRRLSSGVLRAGIMIVGTAVAVRMLLG